jgi:hypothetical protein
MIIVPIADMLAVAVVAFTDVSDEMWDEMRAVGFDGRKRCCGLVEVMASLGFCGWR